MKGWPRKTNPSANNDPRMKIVSIIIQTIVALGLLNVWLLRFNRSTPFRGGSAQSMPEEFAAYGLPKWLLWTVGVLKVSSALCLVVGIWVQFLVMPAAALIAVLMLGAIAMHLKVHDPAIKSLPAGAVLALTAFVLANAV